MNLKIMSSEEQYRVFICVCVFFSEQLQLLNAFTLTNTKMVCIFLFFFCFFFAGGGGGGVFHHSPYRSDYWMHHNCQLAPCSLELLCCSELFPFLIKSGPFIHFSDITLCEFLLSAISPQRGSNYLTHWKLVYLGRASPLWKRTPVIKLRFVKSGFANGLSRILFHFFISEDGFKLSWWRRPQETWTALFCFRA